MPVHNHKIQFSFNRREVPLTNEELKFVIEKILRLVMIYLYYIIYTYDNILSCLYTANNPQDTDTLPMNAISQLRFAQAL